MNSNTRFEFIVVVTWAIVLPILSLLEAYRGNAIVATPIMLIAIVLAVSDMNRL